MGASKDTHALAIDDILIAARDDSGPRYLKQMIDGGADAAQRFADGLSPLDYAIRLLAPAVVQVLVDGGALCDAKAIETAIRSWRATDDPCFDDLFVERRIAIIKILNAASVESAA